ASPTQNATSAGNQCRLEIPVEGGNAFADDEPGKKLATMVALDDGGDSAPIEFPHTSNKKGNPVSNTGHIHH
ncbi:hypothetical protein X801_07380, partial [Opisthorchis viverrini]